MSLKRTPPLPFAVFGVSTSETVTALRWCAEILYDRSGDVLNQLALGLDRAALQEIDDDFRHKFPRVFQMLQSAQITRQGPLRACLKCVFRLSEPSGVVQ